MKRFEIVFVIMAAAGVLVSVCHANTVSWNYNRNSDAYSTQSTDVAGVGEYSAAYWNDSWLDGRTTDLLDNTGAATTIDIIWQSYNSWSIQGSHPGTDTDGSHNKEILNGYLNSGPAGWNPPLIYSRATLSQIGYSSYEIVVYFSSDVAGREGYVTDGSSTYYFNTLGPVSIASGNALFTQATVTTEDGYAVAANYAVFSGLSGASQIITVQMRDTDEWGGIAAVQIVSNPYSAKTPSPANGATLVPVDTALSWAAPEAFTPTGYNVRIGTDPNMSTILATNTPNTTVDPSPSGDLAYNTKYYWRVDTLEPNTPNPIVHTGNVWNFTTIPNSPIITTQPTSQTVAAGANVDFSITALNTTTYTWYKSADAVVGSDTQVGNSSTLTLNSVQIADEPYYYYCVAHGPTAPNATSNMVTLAIKRQVAHWTLDALVSGQYEDSSGEGHNADPNGTPTFVTGAGASTGNGVTITTAVGWASAGTWDPSQYSGQFTLSLWAKWAGQTNPTTWQGLFSKETSYGSGTMMWQLEVVSAEQASSNVMLKNGLETGNLTISPLTVGTWEHLTVTFDGTTATIYRNGVNVASGTWSMGTKTDAPIHIGISAISATENLMFNGDLDDIQIYNYALNNVEVADLYLAVRDNFVCINEYASQYDFNGNCIVDLGDFVALAQQWLDCGRYPVSECQQ